MYPARDGRSCVSETQFNRPYRGRIKLSAQVQGFEPEAHFDKGKPARRNGFPTLANMHQAFNTWMAAMPA